MLFIIITLITALTIAGVAAWYSITGLAAIFASAAVPIMIMGAVLEVGKLVTASWLYRNWKQTSLLLKTYLTTSVVVLMFITSIGIFGFLSKAHLDQVIEGGGLNAVQIASLERKIEVEQRSIINAENLLSQLDETVNTLIEYDRIRGADGAVATRENQKEEREEINEAINSAQIRIEEYQTELFPLKKRSIELEAEVGPLKYVAELIYGDEAQSHFDEAVRWIIILIIFVFDPLAVLLLIAANQSLVQRREEKEGPNILEVEDESVRVIPDQNIYDKEDDEEDEEPRFVEFDEEEEFAEPTEIIETYEDDEEAPESGPTDDRPGVVARVPYNAAKGWIEESRGR